MIDTVYVSNATVNVLEHEGSSTLMSLSVPDELFKPLINLTSCECFNMMHSSCTTISTH